MQKYFKRLALFIGSILLVLQLNACTMKSMYGQLDWILAGMVEDFMSLDEAQEADVKGRITALLKWHRKTQLPLYIDDLEQMQTFTTNGLTEENIEIVFQSVKTRWQAVQTRLAPDFAEVLVNVSDKQKQQIFAELKERNDEVDKDYATVTGKEREQRTGDKMIENFERWLGDLNESQQKILRSGVKQFKDMEKERLEFRNSWQAQLKNVLDSKQDHKTRQAALQELFASPETYQSAAYQEKFSYNVQQIKQMVLKLHPTLTKEQQVNLAEKTQYYIRNFKELVNSG